MKLLRTVILAAAVILFLAVIGIQIVSFLNPVGILNLEQSGAVNLSDMGTFALVLAFSFFGIGLLAAMLFHEDLMPSLELGRVIGGVVGTARVFGRVSLWGKIAFVSFIGYLVFVEIFRDTRLDEIVSLISILSAAGLFSLLTMMILSTTLEQTPYSPRVSLWLGSIFFLVVAAVAMLYSQTQQASYWKPEGEQTQYIGRPVGNYLGQVTWEAHLELQKCGLKDEAFSYLKDGQPVPASLSRGESSGHLSFKIVAPGIYEVRCTAEIPTSRQADVLPTKADVLPTPTQAESNMDVLIQSPPTTIDVQILEVRRPGDITSESVTIVNAGLDISLDGWILTGKNHNEQFVFPRDLKLFNGMSVTIFTTSGPTSPAAYYWGLNEAIWEPDDVVQLFNSSGELMDEHTIR